MRQKGFVLFVVMILLVIMSLLGAAMFRGFTQDEKMAGNYREKHRAQDAAQTALDTAQFWMAQSGNTYTGNWITGVACNGATSAPVICSNALASPTAVPWANYTTLTPSGMTVNAGGGVNTYATNVNYYIQYLGNTAPFTALYQVTSTAQGGNANAVSVLQSVYQVKASSRDIGGS